MGNEPRASKRKQSKPVEVVNTTPVESEEEEVTVYTSRLFELNIMAQDAVREFALHDIDDTEGLEKKRVAMHDAFTQLYDEAAQFIEAAMSQEFDVAYLRSKIESSEPGVKEQLSKGLKDLEEEIQQNMSEMWMARVLAWLHQAAAASGPFVEREHEDKKKEASRHLAAVYSLLEKPFSAIPSKTDGAQKLRRVALGHMALSLITGSSKAQEADSADIQSRSKTAEAEFYDEFLNELIGTESTFRQAFNPFDELILRDMLSSFIFEQATDLYNEALPLFEKSKTAGKQRVSMIKAWKQNTAGLSEVYMAMTYNDIADAQMRSGNLEDASKLYQESSDAFGRAEKCFQEVLALQSNAEQSANDKEQKKALSLFCRAEASVPTLSELLEVNNKEEAMTMLAEIFKGLKKAEKLAKARELVAAIKENLKIFSFIEDMLTKQTGDIGSIKGQIDFAKDLRKTALIEIVGKSLDEAGSKLASDPSGALDSVREGLSSLGILLSLESDDEEVGNLRNRTLAMLSHLKYVIQFQVSSQKQHGVQFILSRILENLHASDAASYYKVIGETPEADELTDLGKLALSTAYASEAQIFAKQSEQWAFKAQLSRANALKEFEDEMAQFQEDDASDSTVTLHDDTIKRIRQTVAAFEAATNELNSVKGEEIRRKNNVDSQVKQLQGVVVKFRGDLSRLLGAKNDFLAEVFSKKGDTSKAKQYFSQASDALREAVGSYTVAAQMFQNIGDAEAAQSVDNKARTTDLIARSVWDNRQRMDTDQTPTYMGDNELAALYLGTGGQQ